MLELKISLVLIAFVVGAMTRKIWNMDKRIRKLEEWVEKTKVVSSRSWYRIGEGTGPEATA